MEKDFQEELHILTQRIQECEKIEHSLRESESRFRTLVEHIPAITYISALDKNNTLLYVSPQIQKILGYSPQEYRTDPDLWRKQLHPEDHDRVMAELVSSRVADRNFVSEYRKISRDGAIVWFHDEAVTIRDSSGKPLFLQGVMYDITRQKLAEKALENAFTELEKRVNQRTFELNRSNETLQKEVAERRRAEKVASKLASFPILDPMPVIELNPHGIITYINPSGIRLFPDILTTGLDHPFLKNVLEITQRLAEEEKQSVTRETEIGGVWYLQFIFRVDEGVRIYSIDITERKHFETALKESEQELKAVVEGSPIPQFVIDKEHTIIHWNKPLEKYTGLPAARMIGTRNHYTAFYNYQRPVMADLVLDNATGDISRWYPGKFTKSQFVDDAYEAVDFFPQMGGTGVWLHFTAAPIRDSRGATIGAIQTLEDITPQKNTEQALKQSEERFRTVANYVYDWEYLVDTEKKLIYTTPSCERFTGYRPEDFYANPNLLQTIIHPDDRKRYLDHLSLESETEATLDVRIRHRNGKEFWINHICHPVVDDTGKSTGRRISNTDISKQKLLENTLTVCTDASAVMAENIPGAIFTSGVKDDQAMKTVSDGIRRLTGFGPHDFISRKVSFNQLVVDEDRHKVAEARSKAAQRKQAYEVVYRIKDAQGRLRTVREKGRATEDPSGEPVMTAIVLDSDGSA